MQDVYTLVAAKVMERMHSDIQAAHAGIAARAQQARQAHAASSSFPTPGAELEAGDEQQTPQQMDRDARWLVAKAEMLLPHVNRKLVKQTVSSWPSSGPAISGEGSSSEARLLLQNVRLLLPALDWTLWT